MLRPILAGLTTALLAAASPMSLAAPAPKNSPIAYQKKVILGVRAYVVTVDLNCKRIALVPHSSSGQYKSFRSFIRDHQPLAAINGTFFDPATATVVCNLIAEGKLLSEGRVGHSLRIDSENRAQLESTAGLPGRLLDLKQWAFGLSAGPTLLRQGQAIASARNEGFRDPGLFGLAPRSAIGITPNNKLLLVTVRKPVRLARLSWMMKRLGARDAMNLDGGSSTALYYQGAFVTRPRRLLTNIVGVYLRPKSDSPAAIAQPPAPLYDEVNQLPVALQSPSVEAPPDPTYVEIPEEPLPPV